MKKSTRGKKRKRSIGFDQEGRYTFQGPVGIGTADPSVRLEVNSGDPSESSIFGINTPESFAFLTFSGGSNLKNPQISWKKGKTLLFRTADTMGGFAASDKLCITDEGKVGIGKATPEYALDVAGSINSSDIYVGGKVGIKTKEPVHELDVKGTINADEILKKGSPLSVSQWEDVTGGINYEGKVGIGTANPKGELDVAGTIKAQGILVEGTFKSARVDADEIFEGGFPVTGSKWNDVEGGISYEGGKVSIGKTLPQHDLDVEGTINAKEILKNGSPLSVSQWKDIRGGITYENGNVGIGTKSPNRDLTVHKAGAGTGVYQNTKNDAHEILIGVDRTAIVSAMTASDLQIRTNNRPRMVIKANTGNVGIGTLDPYSELSLTGSIGFTNSRNPMMYIFQSGTTNPERAVIAHSPPFSSYGLFYDDKTDNFLFKGSGQPVMAFGLGNKAVQYWGTLARASSRELKENIEDLGSDEAFDIFQSLKPVKFNLKSDHGKTPQLGFIAEEVPELASSSDGNGVINDHIVSLLTKVVKDQHDKLSALSEKLRLLEAKYERTNGEAT